MMRTLSLTIGQRGEVVLNDAISYAPLHVEGIDLPSHEVDAYLTIAPELKALLLGTLMLELSPEIPPRQAGEPSDAYLLRLLAELLHTQDCTNLEAVSALLRRLNVPFRQDHWIDID